MKKIFLAMIVAVIMTSWAMAGPLPTVKIDSQHSTSNGGLFSVTTSDHGSFDTFCIETSEFLNIGATYFYEVSTAAKWNGTLGTTSDPISKATAWLFVNFRTVVGYDGSHAQNALVQEAIWLLENEVGGSSNAYYLAATTGLRAGWEGIDANGYLGVYAMNLNVYDPATVAGAKQDLLIRLPDGGVTVLLLGLGVACLALFARRFGN